MHRLTNCLKLERYGRIELHQVNTKVRGTGDFRLPDPIVEFKTSEEARAFINGATWAVKHFGGEVLHYMKEFDD